MKLIINDLISYILLGTMGVLIISLDYFISLVRFQMIKQRLSAYPKITTLLSILSSINSVLIISFGTFLIFINIISSVIFMVLYAICIFQLYNMKNKWN